ncbi:MAG: hypothetical protein IPH13_01290 [Planctomycetes bacterium]|nr:hypothetical protein [Planctomycetota bacterium]
MPEEPRLSASRHSPTDDAETAPPPEGRGAFGGFIGPRTLIDQVRVAAPYLFDASHPRSSERPNREALRLHELARHPLGWWEMLFRADLLPAQEQPSPAARTDYFALCLAAHFASCATYVPTDVDAKIRHALWFEQEDPTERAHMLNVAQALAHWDVRRFSARLCRTQADPIDLEPERIVSGHDGERLSVLVGAMLASIAFADVEAAARFEDLVDQELRREAAAFLALEREPGRELDLLALAATLTHNVGDVNQSLESSSAKRVGDAQKHRFGKLAQERPERYSGAYARAALLYRELLAPEGHRNYPLRRVKALRTHPDLLYPLGPFVDAWGERVATWPTFTSEIVADVVAALVDGCRRLGAQESYYRALAGIDARTSGGLLGRGLDAHHAPATRRALREPLLRRKIAVPRVSFESSYRKRVRALLGR